MLELHRCRQIEWGPTAVVALATSVNGAVVAAARENGAIELWNVAAGSVGWHCYLTIPGRKDSAISSLVWCRSCIQETATLGRLFSAGLDGLITEWNLQTLQPKDVVSSNGGSVWQLAVEPRVHLTSTKVIVGQPRKLSSIDRNGDVGSSSDESNSDTSDNDEDEEEEEEEAKALEQQVAVGCDDGCVKLFTVDDSTKGMVYQRSFPRVKGRILSLAWSSDASRIYAGGSDGCIRCWDATRGHEVIRITAGIGGIGGGSDLCVWCLLVLKDGTIVSGDSSGSTQFWEGRHGTLLQAHTKHQADVLALAATPSGRGVFASGADGQVVLFQHVGESRRVTDGGASDVTIGIHGDKWVFAGSKRSHTHDVRALTVAFPAVEVQAYDKREMQRSRKNSSKGQDYIKWAQPGTAMLISGGNDAKLFTYPAESFLAFHSHDICPAPQCPRVQLSNLSDTNDFVFMMVQHTSRVDLWKIHSNQSTVSSDLEDLQIFGKSILGKRKFPDDLQNSPRKKPNGHVVHSQETLPVSVVQEYSNGKVESYQYKEDPPPYGQGKGARPGLLARIEINSSEHIVCSAIACNGCLLAFSNRLKPRLYLLEQKHHDSSNSQKMFGITRKKLPSSLPAAHCMLFTPDCTRLLLGCSDEILVVNVEISEIVHSFRVLPTLAVRESAIGLSPPSLMCASADGQWLAVGTTSGHLHVYNLETLRHHWSVPVMDGSVATAATFRPSSTNVLIIGTATNQVHVLDVEAKELSQWSKVNSGAMSKHLLEFPGGILGLSLPPSSTSTSVIAYSSRAMCLIDFSKPIGRELIEGQSALSRGEISGRIEEKSTSGKGRHVEANGHGNGLKKESESKTNSNFVIVPFKDPVLFLGYCAQRSVLVVEKPWLEVLRTFPPPVYRHLYGT